MTATDTGTLLTLSSGGVNMSGGAAYLVVKKVGSTVAAQSYTAAIQGGGLTALYTTTGVEFPSGGQYSVQLKYVNGSDTWSSNILPITINPVLV